MHNVGSISVRKVFLLELIAPSGLGVCKLILMLFSHHITNQSNKRKCFWTGMAFWAVQARHVLLSPALT